MTDPWRAVYDEAYELMLRKNKDYGPEAISGAPSGPVAAVLNKLWERICRLKNLHQAGREPEFEDFRGGAIDLINFGVMLVLVIDDDWDAGPGAEEEVSWERHKPLTEEEYMRILPVEPSATVDDLVYEILAEGVTTSDGRFFKLTEVLPDAKVKAVDPDENPEHPDCNAGTCNCGDYNEEPYGDELGERYENLRNYVVAKNGEAITRIIEGGHGQSE